MLKHLVCFVLSVALSAALIASVDWTHSYFVTLLTKPIEKNIAENVARDYSQLMMHANAVPRREPEHKPDPAPLRALMDSPTSAPMTNDISDYVANMNHTYTPDQYVEMKCELKNFMQSAYDDDTTEIADIPNL
jgi:predicted oxidoreductase